MEGLRDSAVKKVKGVCTMCRYYRDKCAPHQVRRWVVTAVLALIYGFRVFYFLHRFYLLTFLLGAFCNLLFFMFLKPLVRLHPKVRSSDGPMLPINVSDDFKPFIRYLPEFKFWRALTVAILIAFVMTFFPALDVPMDVPMALDVPMVLILFWIVLFGITLIDQIYDMRKHKYNPITFGKKKYEGKKHAAAPSDSCAVEGNTGLV